MSARDFDESIESIDRRIAQLRARRRDEIAHHTKRERSAKGYASMALGQRLVSWVGDWHQIDPARFDAFLAASDPSTIMDGAPEALSTTQALKRLHTWVRGREEEDDAREAAAEEAKLASVGASFE